MTPPTTQRPDWEPAGVTFPASEAMAYGDEWPTSVTVEKWERNARGERRIRETRTYVLAAHPTSGQGGEK